MTHIFKTGDTGLTRDGKHRFMVLIDDLNGKCPLVVRITEITTGAEWIETRVVDGVCWKDAIPASSRDLIPPEPKIIGSVWVPLRYNGSDPVYPSDYHYTDRNNAINYIEDHSTTLRAMRQDILARFDTYDDGTVDVKVEKVP